MHSHLWPLPPDGSTVTPTTTSVFEQCLVDWGRKLRVRVKMTLRIGQLPSGEVDVEVRDRPGLGASRAGRQSSLGSSFSGRQPLVSRLRLKCTTRACCLVSNAQRCQSAPPPVSPAHVQSCYPFF